MRPKGENKPAGTRSWRRQRWAQSEGPRKRTWRPSVWAKGPISRPEPRAVKDGTGRRRKEEPHHVGSIADAGSRQVLFCGWRDSGAACGRKLLRARGAPCGRGRRGRGLHPAGGGVAAALPGHAALGTEAAAAARAGRCQGARLRRHGVAGNGARARAALVLPGQRRRADRGRGRRGARERPVLVPGGRARRDTRAGRAFGRRGPRAGGAAGPVPRAPDRASRRGERLCRGPQAGRNALPGAPPARRARLRRQQLVLRLRQEQHEGNPRGCRARRGLGRRPCQPALHGDRRRLAGGARRRLQRRPLGPQQRGLPGHGGPGRRHEGPGRAARHLDPSPAHARGDAGILEAAPAHPGEGAARRLRAGPERPRGARARARHVRPAGGLGLRAHQAGLLHV